MPVGSSSSVAKITPRTPEAEQSTSQSEYTQFLSTIAKSPALITGYSKLLKAAGYYKGKITDKYTPALQKAFTRAEEDRLSISTVRPIGRDAFLQETISLGGTGAGTGGPSTVTSVTKYTPESAKELVNSIIQDTLGRKATAAEIKKYTQALKGIEGKASTVTKYSGSGANIVCSYNSGSFNNVYSHFIYGDGTSVTAGSDTTPIISFQSGSGKFLLFK